MRDVSKILTDAEVLSLRALLKQVDEAAPGTGGSYEFLGYPKILYAPAWLMLWRISKDHPDPLVRKQNRAELRKYQVIVTDLEMEEEYLADGWVSDPNDLIVAEALKVNPNDQHPDPRVPWGREGRRAAAEQRRDRDRELADIRRRYAELTGRRLLDEVTVAADAVDPAGPDEDLTDEPAALAEAAPVAPRPRTARPRQQTQAPTSKRDRVMASARESARA
jgi:hypothetical protein